MLSSTTQDFDSYGFSTVHQQFSQDPKFTEFLKTLPDSLVGKVDNHNLQALFSRLSSLMASKEPFTIDFSTIDIKDEYKLPIVVAIIDSLKQTLDKRLILKVIHPPKLDYKDVGALPEIGYFAGYQASDFEDSH